MDLDWEQTEHDAKQRIYSAASMKELQEARVTYLGRKGLMTEIYTALAAAPPEEKPVIGQKANQLKKVITQALQERKEALAREEQAEAALDVTLPGIVPRVGREHLITQTTREICAIFERLGFVIQEGPEIESEAHNFEGLNIPEDHPARDGFDTFYLDAPDPDHPQWNLLLRSHTSPGQVRIMKEHTPPLAVVIPGRVYRPDAVDASHSFMFHQVEGLLVDRNVSFADLKGLLTTFCRKFFGPEIRMRFRPHYFPFTEPSAEVDISCYLCDGKGCSVCGRKGWLEIMGCGLVHPAVFKAVGYPKGKYSGLAFGLGVERIVMLRYGIKDIRIFFENDTRFLVQF